MDFSSFFSSGNGGDMFKKIAVVRFKSSRLMARREYFFKSPRCFLSGGPITSLKSERDIFTIPSADAFAKVQLVASQKSRFNPTSTPAFAKGGGSLIQS